MFDNNTLVNDFAQTFYRCDGLTGSIPSGLFNNNPSVTIFSQTFYGCNGLTSIPSGLFDNTSSVGNFNGCFDGCTGLTSSFAPELWNMFPGIVGANCANCFKDDTLLTNYYDIPETWGGPAVSSSSSIDSSSSSSIDSSSSSSIDSSSSSSSSLI